MFSDRAAQVARRNSRSDDEPEAQGPEGAVHFFFVLIAPKTVTAQQA